MGQARVEIQILPDNHFPNQIHLIMSRTLANKLGIQSHPIWITYGTAYSSTYMAISDIGSTSIRMSESLATQLNYGSHSSFIHAQFDRQLQRLRLGPLLGIFINSLPQSQENPPYGPMNKFLEECMIAGKIKGINVIVFSPEQINPDQKRIQGWFHDQGKWITGIYPIPDCIYNRLTSRRVEKQDFVQKTLEHLKQKHRILFFNEQFLDKHQVYQILSKHPSMKSLMPETQMFHIHDFRSFLKKHNMIFLKPTNGSLGNGIIRLCKLENNKNEWLMEAITANGITASVHKTPELIRKCVKRIGRQPYIMQQGLNLLTYDQRPIDFRVLVQKNGKGQWSVTSTVCRVANDQHFVSNLARGGTIRKAYDVLQEMDTPTKPSVQQLKQIAIQIAQHFEQLAEGHYAELGIDLAIDEKGKIWMIEINSKPSKTDDTIMNTNNTIRPSVLKLMEFVKFLTGFSRPSPKKNHYLKRRKPR